MKSKKAVLQESVNALSSFAIGVFVFIIVVFATFKGATSIQSTIVQDSAVNNATYHNMTALLGSVGQFANYGDLIVIVGILAIVILLVSSAFVSRR